jgi:hypothetical protein
MRLTFDGVGGAMAEPEDAMAVSVRRRGSRSRNITATAGVGTLCCCGSSSRNLLAPRGDFYAEALPAPPGKGRSPLSLTLHRLRCLPQLPVLLTHGGVELLGEAGWEL